MQRKIEDERDARACLRAARRAGLSAGAWARAHGIDGRSLNAWRVNLGLVDGGRARAARLVELVRAPAGATASRYLVRVAGAEVELGDDFQEETLVRLVRALRAC